MTSKTLWDDEISERIDYHSIVKSISSRVLKSKKGQATLSEVIAITMAVVEHVSGDKKLKSTEKKELALSLIVVIIDILVDLGKITREEGENLKGVADQSAKFIDEFIDSVSLLTNNPDLINAGKWVLKEGVALAEAVSKEECKCIII